MSRNKIFKIRKPGKEIDQSQQPVVLEKLDDYPFKSVAMATTRSNLTGSWRFWRPYYLTKRAPCDGHCPVGNQIAELIQAAGRNDFREAAAILREENPLPAITARVCHRPCELKCNRRRHDEKVAIHTIEGVLAEVDSEMTKLPGSDRIRTVAVLGSGPAQLGFAHFMASLQHRVTLFESGDTLGGSLRKGPQARHIPPHVLNAELGRIVDHRMEVKCSHRLETDFTLNDLQRDFDVAFGELTGSGKLGMIISARGGANLSYGKSFLDPASSGDEGSERFVAIPRRVSEAIGCGKRAALLLDADWRGLSPREVLSSIRVGGDDSVVSARKYRELLTGRVIRRSEEMVDLEDLRSEFFEATKDTDPSTVDRFHTSLTADHVSRDDVLQAMQETNRCLSCGLCNNCDNCWIFCPDGCISRSGDGYLIDYDYCKGCQLCVAVCPRGVLSTIEEQKWSE